MADVKAASGFVIPAMPVIPAKPVIPAMPVIAVMPAMPAMPVIAVIPGSDGIKAVVPKLGTRKVYVINMLKP